MTQPNVYMCYCRDNKPQAKQLQEDLTKAGFEVWWEEKIVTGRDRHLEIRKAVRQSFSVVTCFSQEAQSRDRAGMYHELRDAIDAYRKLKPGGICFIPVRFSQCDIPHFEIDAGHTLAELHYVDLFPPASRHDGITRLVSSLRAAPRHPR